MGKKHKSITTREANLIFLKVCWDMFVKPFNWHHLAFIIMFYGFLVNFLVGTAFVQLEGRVMVDFSVSDIHFHLHRLQNPHEIWSQTAQEYYPPLFHGVVGYLIKLTGSSVNNTIAFLVPLIHWIILPASLYYLSRDFWESKHYGGITVILYFLGTSFTNFSSLIGTWPHAVSMAMLFWGLREQVIYLRKKGSNNLKRAFFIGILITLTHGVTCIIYWLLLLTTTIIAREYRTAILVFLVSSGIGLSTLGKRFIYYVTNFFGSTEKTIFQDSIAPALPFLLVWANPAIIYWAYKEVRSWAWQPEQLLMLTAAAIIPALAFPIDPAYRPVHMFGMMCAVLAPRAAENMWRKRIYWVCGWGVVFFWFHFLIYLGNILRLMGVFAEYGIGDPIP